MRYKGARVVHRKHTILLRSTPQIERHNCPHPRRKRRIQVTAHLNASNYCSRRAGEQKIVGGPQHKNSLNRVPRGNEAPRAAKCTKGQAAQTPTQGPPTSRSECDNRARWRAQRRPLAGRDETWVAESGQTHPADATRCPNDVPSPSSSFGSAAWEAPRSEGEAYAPKARSGRRVNGSFLVVVRGCHQPGPARTAQAPTRTLRP